MCVVIRQAIFEIITSEHSYLHSLGILVRCFKSSDALKKTMTATDYHHLFSNISVIEQISKRWVKHRLCLSLKRVHIQKRFLSVCLCQIDRIWSLQVLNRAANLVFFVARCILIEMWCETEDWLFSTFQVAYLPSSCPVGSIHMLKHASQTGSTALCSSLAFR